MMKPSTSSMNKMQMASLATKTASNGETNDKENRQRLSNRQGLQSANDTASQLTLKRNKTSEGVYRQSIVHSR